jgi:hypothetical protein
MAPLSRNRGVSATMTRRLGGPVSGTWRECVLTRATAKRSEAGLLPQYAEQVLQRSVSSYGWPASAAFWLLQR